MTRNAEVGIAPNAPFGTTMLPRMAKLTERRMHIDYRMVWEFVQDEGLRSLRAVCVPVYGRIYDHGLVSAVQLIAGTGDTRWKVPGVLDWLTRIYNPRVDVTKEMTKLYALDRDVFLVDYLNPIEAGLLPDGSPNLFCGCRP